jgi:ditrans,polycis-polyprenyl diphosphate synthase
MSTWFKESKFNWYQRLAVNIIKSGPVPNHIAFIMDGNRRFATKINKKKYEGHAEGFEKLSETLQWCLDLGIKEVTVYAFSIENFKRSPEEVDTLMSLAREKFKKMLEEQDKLMEQGICIRIIGNLKLLPLDIQKTVAEAMLLTKNNKTAILNVAFAYTSRDELTSSMTTILEGVECGDLDVKDIDEHLIDKCLYTRHCSEPDLLLRTSGESRFSDFLLWQVCGVFLFMNHFVLLNIFFFFPF